MKADCTRRIAPSTAPLARYPARMLSLNVEARSVSARTVEATEKAIADNAADNHSTVSSAPPRRRLSWLLLRSVDIGIRLIGVA